MNNRLAATIEDSILNTKKLPGAILINGGWGSGKTYFWNEILASKLNKKGIDTAYVSLFNANDSQKIKSDILQSYGKNKKGILRWSARGKAFWRRISHSFQKWTEANHGVNPYEIIGYSPEILNSLPVKTVVCIDDFERCGQFKNDALNIINYLVEHRNCKVIILSNLVEDDENQKNYFEKVIYRTFEFTNNLADLFEDIIADYSSEKSRTILTQYKEDILNVFERLSCRNIRTFMKFTSQASEILDAAGELVSVGNIKQTASFVVYKSLKGDLGSHPSLYYPRHAASKFFKKRDKPNELSKSDWSAAEFYENYFLKEFEFDFSEEICKYVVCGNLDREALLRELEPVDNNDLLSVLTHKLVRLDWVHYSENELRETCEQVGNIFIPQNYDRILDVLVLYENLLEIYDVLGISDKDLEETIKKYISSLPALEIKISNIKHVDQKYIDKIEEKYKLLHHRQAIAKYEKVRDDVVEDLSNKRASNFVREEVLHNYQIIAKLAEDPQIIALLESLLKSDMGLVSDFYRNVASMSEQHFGEDFNARMRIILQKFSDNKDLDLLQKHFLKRLIRWFS